MTRLLLIAAVLALFANPLTAGPSDAELWQQFQADKGIKSLDSEFDEEKAERPAPQDSPKPALELPSANAQAAMVRESIQFFALAVKHNDMRILHNHGALAFQGQFSVEKLHEVFKGFTDQKIDLTILNPLMPQFDAPMQKHPEHDLVGMIGHYTVGSNKVIFKLQYLHENGAWKMFAINVEIP
jgi:hypothetical protein